jgi:hypothetical protein
MQLLLTIPFSVFWKWALENLSNILYINILRIPRVRNFSYVGMLSFSRQPNTKYQITAQGREKRGTSRN